VTTTADRGVTQPQVGDELPPLVLEASVRAIVSTAIATRDYQDVHHDVAAAQQRGSTTIFTNILTTNGYCLRLVTDWAGPDAVVQKAAIRLGVPNYAGDTLTLTGVVDDVQPGDDGTRVVVRVRGANSLGDHVTGTVQVLLPGATS
jgi:acyl dehydratase